MKKSVIAVNAINNNFNNNNKTYFMRKYYQKIKKSDKNYKKTVLQNNTYCVQILYWSSLYFSHFSNQLLKKPIHTYLLYFEIPGYTIFFLGFFSSTKPVFEHFFSFLLFSVTFYLLTLLSLFL